MEPAWDGADAKICLINASLMSTYDKKQAAMFGEITTVHPTGRGFTIKTPDDAYIQVVLSQPVAVEPHQWVEVRGTVEGRQRINALDVIPFPKDYTADMDKESYNELVKLHQQHGERYWLYKVGEEEKEALPPTDDIPNLEIGDDQTNAILNSQPAGGLNSTINGNDTYMM